MKSSDFISFRVYYILMNLPIYKPNFFLVVWINYTDSHLRFLICLKHSSFVIKGLFNQSFVI